MLIHAFTTPVDKQTDFMAFCKAMRATEISLNVFQVMSRAKPALYLVWCEGNDCYRNVELASAY
jgi:hypothetical protein